MTDFIKAHQHLHQLYGEQLYQGDSLIPYTYTPAQKAILSVIEEDHIPSTESLVNQFQEKGKLHGATYQEILNEILKNSLISAWLKDVHHRLCIHKEKILPV